MTIVISPTKGFSILTSVFSKTVPKRDMYATASLADLNALMTGSVVGFV